MASAAVTPGNFVPVPGPNGFPTTLNGIGVNLIQGKAGAATALPLRAAYQTNCAQPCSPVTGITLQIPFELESNFTAAGDPAPCLQLTQNGGAVGGVSLAPVSDNVHVLNTCDDSQVYISVPQSICGPTSWSAAR